MTLAKSIKILLTPSSVVYPVIPDRGPRPARRKLIRVGNYPQGAISEGDHSRKHITYMSSFLQPSSFTRSACFFLPPFLLVVWVPENFGQKRFDRIDQASNQLEHQNMNFYPPPAVVTADVHHQIKTSLRSSKTTAWASAFPRSLNSVFLEGPLVTENGDIFSVDGL